MGPLSVPPPLHSRWTPAYPIVRSDAVERVARALAHGSAPAGPAFAAVLGPPGSGRTTVAILGARAWADGIRRAGQRPPRALRVRIPECRGTAGVAAALLREWDPSFGGRGYSTVELLRGFLRRVGRDGSGAVVVLDDFGPDAPDLARVVSALIGPRGLPGPGTAATPPMALVLVGRSHALRGLPALPNGEDPRLRSVSLEPYSVEELVAILRDRLARVGSHGMGEGELARLAERAHRDVAPATRALELLRAALGFAPEDAPARSGRDARELLRLEPWFLMALAAECRGGAADLTAIRRREAAYARARGVRPLATTTFWRRIVRLEDEGWLRRAVRNGGPGGTRSVVRLAESARVRLEAITRRESPRDDGPAAPGPAPYEAARPTPRSPTGPARPAPPIPPTPGPASAPA
jgi:hypothetical protein